MSTRLTKCIVLLNLATAYSFNVMHFTNIKEEELMRGISKVLNNYNKKRDKNKDFASRIAVRGSRKNHHNNFDHKMLVRSIVHHEEKAKFDTKDATYAQMIRLHQKKPIFIKDNDEYISQGTLKVGGIINNTAARNHTGKGIPYNNANWWEKIKALKNKNKDESTENFKENNSVRILTDDLKFVLRKTEPSKYEMKHQNGKERIKRRKNKRTNGENNFQFSDLYSSNGTINKTKRDKLKIIKDKVRNIWKRIKDIFIGKKNTHMKFKNTRSNDGTGKSGVEQLLNTIKVNTHRKRKEITIRKTLKENNMPRATIDDYDIISESIASILPNYDYIANSIGLNSWDNFIDSQIKKNQTGESVFESIALKENRNADSEIAERWKNILTKRIGRDSRSKYHKRNKDSRDADIRLLRTLLNNMGVNPALRAGRSGEDDPATIFDTGRPSTKPPEKWLPKYSFWNYWTYDKELYQDDCDGNMIKIGGICVGAPPH